MALMKLGIREVALVAVASLILSWVVINPTIQTIFKGVSALAIIFMLMLLANKLIKKLPHYED